MIKMTPSVCGFMILKSIILSLCTRVSGVLLQDCLNDAECSTTHGCPPLLPNVPQQPALMASPN